MADREWQDRDRAPVDAIVVMAYVAQLDGALNLAAVLLDSLLAADTSLNAVQQGRIMAQRAASAWKLGQMEEAAHRYRALQGLAKREHSIELTVRSLMGFAALAQVRGNYPELGKYCARAARLADRAGLTRLARHAHSGLMIVAGTAHRFDDALMHGWRVYQSSIGYPLEEGEILVGLGQLLLEAGRFAEARAAFSLVLSRKYPVLILLPALGGYALASAGTSSEASVHWAAGEVKRLEQSTTWYHGLADAHFECACALASLGRSGLAEEHRLSALRIAEAHGFHEFAYRSRALNTRHRDRTGAPAHDLNAASEGIAREVSWLEPEQLPRHVSVAIAP
jgi:tetratricopeptide (TPR) repeat protein